MAKRGMCHERKRIDMGDHLIFEYWCGRRSMTEEFVREPELASKNEEALEPMTPEELKDEKNHCRGCLKEKQAWRGEEYMRKEGYPVWDRKKRKWKREGSELSK